MARKVRVFVENLSQHVLLKGLNTLSIFQDESDYKVFQEMLKELHAKYALAIHAYILLPQYFEFVATPQDAESLPRFMQSLGRKYVAYFNKKYKRSGTIFEGRYKASLVEDALYLFDIMKHIESAAPKEYLYSSIGKNLYNKVDAIVSCHKLYKKLGFRDEQRVLKYSQIFNRELDKDLDAFIKNSLEKQLVTGSAEFIKNLETTVGITLGSKNRGRPKKQHKGKKMYKNLVVLDKEKHKNLKMTKTEDFSFAKETPFIPVVAQEVALVGASFPVVFSTNEESSLIGLVSLGGSSLAINEKGEWREKYVPSFLKKYPFALVATKENPEQKVILIDEESSLLSKSKGKQLFKKSGEQTEILTNSIKNLTDYENQNIITKNVVKLIAESGILEDKEISVGEGEEKKVLVNGFKVVNREKLNKLSDDILADWVRKGIITLIDAHLKSLANIQSLFNLAQQRQK